MKEKLILPEKHQIALEDCTQKLVDSLLPTALLRLRIVKTPEDLQKFHERDIEFLGREAVEDGSIILEAAENAWKYNVELNYKNIKE